MLEYFDRKRKRILLENGKSVTTPENICRMILRGNDISGFCVDDEDEIQRYRDMYRENISPHGEPEYEELVSEDTAREELIRRITESPRYISTGEYEDRIVAELRFFEKSKNLEFLVRVSDLIGKFKEQGVVWGVGRGSSCASLVCYLLEINDIDPVEYNIPFVELSKDYSDVD